MGDKEGDRVRKKGLQCMSMPPGKTTFTLLEAAELLSCHRETLRRAIRTGELQAAKLGREFRISRPDLQSFWTACGGGDLFGSEEKADSGAARKKKLTPRKGGGAVKWERQVQFSLPGTGPVSDSTLDGPDGEAADQRERKRGECAPRKEEAEKDGAARE
jgi:excisionase family DNA binding protein